MWQATYEELRSFGFTIITVALDKSPDDARPWIEAAKPAHPSLIDTRHVVADLYNMVNVPTIVWIDARGLIVRPNDVAFGTDTFKHLTGLEAAKHLGALRAWVRGEAAPLPDARSSSARSPTVRSSCFATRHPARCTAGSQWSRCLNPPRLDGLRPSPASACTTLPAGAFVW